jgi:SAM-dependent methyltransferase
MENSKTHWEEIHQSKFTDVSWWQDADKVWLDLFYFVDVTPQDHIVDVGAGSSVLVDELLRSGFQNLTVLDLSASALARTKERLGRGEIPKIAGSAESPEIVKTSKMVGSAEMGERSNIPGASPVHFVCADVLNYRSEVPFHIWHDRAVFHFLITENDRAKYLDSLRANLRPGGYAMIATFAPDGPEQCSGLPVIRHDQESLEKIFGSDFELIFSERREHVTPWGSIQPFTVVIFKLRLSLGGSPR